FLRVVTQNSEWGAGQDLYVLEQNGSELEVVGEINDIAPGEHTYSVRFMEERAYVVTFVKVDPLFSIDLSDPTNPTIAGELKIPGYTDYLQAMNDDFLIGVGRATDSVSDGGTWTLFRELQLSLFD